MRQIVLLRGINVGARNRIAMPQLRELLTGAGFADVRTYVQSGNVVLDSDAPPEQLADEVASHICDGLGLHIDVVARTRDELAEVVRRNPLADVAVDPKRYQVSFLSAALQEEAVRAIAALAVESERFAAIDRELYVWHPEGIARSRLWTHLAGRKLGVTATARNWRTVTALLAMAEE